MIFELMISDKKNTVYQPKTVEGVKLDIERRGSPSRLSFSVLNDEKMTLDVGYQVTLKVDGVGMFSGFIFSLDYSEGDTIDITAYDQLRYLKNKAYYVFKKKTATEMIKHIASQYGLKTGKLTNTPYTMDLIEDGSTLFDIINRALDETLTNTKNLYVLYDDFGSLSLKSLGEMETKIVVNNANSGGYDYSVSIDEATYNEVKLYYDNDKTGKRDVYVEKDSSNIAKWGRLRLLEKLDDGEDGISKAQKLLNLYNAPTKYLNVKNIEGHPSVRGGSIIYCDLTVGKMKVTNAMVVESVTHSFTLDEHKMDVTIRGRKTHE